MLNFRNPQGYSTALWLRGRSAVLVQAGYSAIGTIGSKQRPKLQGSATVNKSVTANINAGNKRIRKAVPYTMNRFE